MRVRQSAPGCVSLGRRPNTSRRVRVFMCWGSEAVGAREGRAAPWIHLGRTVPLGLRAGGEDEEEGVCREEEGNKGRGEVQG